MTMLRMNELCIKSNEVIDDVKAAAWLESELHPELNRHRRHEMADICEPGNIERVWRTLGIAESQVRIALIRILKSTKHTLNVNTLNQPDKWEFKFLFAVSDTVKGFIREKIHEYMVAAVMADRCDTLIPSAAQVWRRRQEEALSALRSIAATTHPHSAPVTRPLWPL